MQQPDTASPPASALGMRFWESGCSELMQQLDKTGGLLVAPSAPSLCAAAQDGHLLRAHHEADHAVIDSGYLALILRLRRAMGMEYRKLWVKRISGLQIIESILSRNAASTVPFRSRKILWVVPCRMEKERINRLLLNESFPANNQIYYVAPEYAIKGHISDDALQQVIGENRPDWIVICISGGKQEKLGWSIRKAFRTSDTKCPAIVCTGAAISFLSGGQAPIPRWADRLYLGWLFRIVSCPRDYFLRYASAFKLPLVLSRLKPASNSLVQS